MRFQSTSVPVDDGEEHSPPRGSVAQGQTRGMANCYTPFNIRNKKHPREWDVFYFYRFEIISIFICNYLDQTIKNI